MRPITTTWLSATGNESAIYNGTTIPNENYFLPINSNEFIGQQPSGVYVFQSIPPVDFGNANVYRTIAISSADDLSGVTFTINGLGIQVAESNGLLNVSLPLNRPFSINIDGPNNEIIETEIYFSRIDSISINVPDIGELDFTIGFGSSGITSPIITDYEKVVFNSTAQLLIFGEVGDNFTYTIWKSASDFECPQVSAGNAPFYYNSLVMFPYSNTTQNKQLSAFASDSSPTTIVFARFKENTTETAVFTYIQQSLR